MIARVIVLNGDYSFLNTIGVRRAITLFVKEKVEILKYSDKTLKTASGKIIKIPLVMRLIKIVRMIYKNKVPYSRKNIMLRDEFKCCYCGSEDNLTIDHVIPKCKGGKSSFENCVTACRPCNNLKSYRTPSEAKMYLIKKPITPTISEFFRIKMVQLGIDIYLKELEVL